MGSESFFAGSMAGTGMGGGSLAEVLLVGGDRRGDVVGAGCSVSVDSLSHAAARRVEEEPCSVVDSGNVSSGAADVAAAGAGRAGTRLPRVSDQTYPCRALLSVAARSRCAPRGRCGAEAIAREPSGTLAAERARMGITTAVGGAIASAGCAAAGTWATGASDVAATAAAAGLTVTAGACSEDPSAERSADRSTDRSAGALGPGNATSATGAGAAASTPGAGAAASTRGAGAAASTRGAGAAASTRGASAAGCTAGVEPTSAAADGAVGVKIIRGSKRRAHVTRPRGCAPSS